MPAILGRMLTLPRADWCGSLMFAFALGGCFSPDRSAVPSNSGETDGTTAEDSAPSSSSAATNTSSSTTDSDATTSTGGTTDATTPGAETSSTSGAAMPTQVAEDDVYFTQQDAALIVDASTGVLDNDVTTDNPAVQVVDSSTSAGGNVTLAADGGFTYSPPTGYWGPDDFSYVLSDADVPDSEFTALVQVWVGPVSVDVDDITMPLGFTVSGSVPSESLGQVLGAAGDVNGDGLGDVIASQQLVPSGSSSVVIFGGTEESNLSTNSTPTWGLELRDESSNAPAGWSVAGAGDVNGDGRDDVIVSSVLFAGNTGRAYVVFGREDPGTIELGALGSTGFVVTGAEVGELAGSDVSGAGDVNGDGLADLVIGAIGANELTGRAYVVFGKADSDAVTLGPSSPGFRIVGDQTGDRVGISVSGAGDMDGDGLADVVIGAIGANKDAGEAYVVFGKPSTNDLSTSNLGNFGFTVRPPLGNDLGRAVSFAGDVNGDGMGDVVVGNGNGNAYVVFGGSSADVDLSFLGNAGFEISGGDEDLGHFVSGGGDVNADGYADIVVGSSSLAPGEWHVIFGKEDSAPVVVSSLDGTDGFTLTGGRGDVAIVQDVNGDGVDDIAVSDPSVDVAAQTSAGRVYVLYGTPIAN